MKALKEKLLDYAPPEGKDDREVRNFIMSDHLNERDIEKCLAYLEELEESNHPHTIREIGIDTNGLLFIKTSTGKTFM
ncbi:hypothetical protein [Neolewinella xylanilytica]|uniref:hypothetical protein n=1 Tax=Neolewinella xylanilytica TaxID=1514080 RepID=UPI0011B01482|nr:hypothetical protein [Neolewinella xylanilytica]